MVEILSKNPSDGQNFLKEVKKPVIKIIAYFSLQSLFTFFYIALLSNIGEGMARTMKTAMFSSIMKQDMKFFDLNRSGEILNM